MPYAELLPSSSKIEIQTDYADRYLIRQLPGASWNAEARAWRVRLSWAACITLRGLFGSNLAVGPALVSWARGEYALRIAHVMYLRDLDKVPDDAAQDIRDVNDMISSVETETGYHLFPYQHADVAFMALNRHAILANPMGTGKSAAAIRTLQVLERMQLGSGDTPFPALVICPNTVKLTWAGELEKFAPELEVSVISGSAGKRRKAFEQQAHVYIINWEALRIHSRLTGYGAMALDDKEKTPKELNKMGFRTVIADEAHRAKEPHAKQTRAMWALMHPAEYRYCLTGTPVVNNVGDLWSLLHAVEPEGFPAKTRYLDRWARVELGFFGGAEILGLKPETAGEFRAVTDPMIRRIPKEVALPQLPEKFPVQYRYTEMTPAQAKLYKAMERDMIIQVGTMAAEGQVMTAANAITQLTRLIQFASASARVETTEKDGDVTHRIVLDAPSSKVNDLVNLLGEMGEEPLVAVAVSSQLINLAAAALSKHSISHGLITGAQSTEERQAAVEQFQAGKIRVMLMTIDAGGEGITLTKASVILFMQRHWSKVKNDQCEDRLHRIGQRYPVQVIDQITPDTVEYRKLAALAEKSGRIEEVIRDQEALARLLGSA